MSLKWCVLSFVLWTTVFSPTLISGLHSKRNKASVELSSEFSGNGYSSVLYNPRISLSDTGFNIFGHRVKRETNSSMLKVRLHNGSYLYRKTSSSIAKAPSETKTRVARGYANKKGGRKGYGYRKPGYVYTSPKPPPLAETTEENDSDFVTPPEPPPANVNPDIGFETTTPTALDPWDIRDSVPGEPGRDYNVLGGIPTTNFSCEGKTPGFYADTEAGCQVFHRCSDDPWYTGQVRVTMDSFLCPNGSLFNQQIYTCDWWGNVDCKTAPEFYQLNEQIGQLEETNAGTIQYVQFSGVRVPPPPGQKRKAPAIIPKSQRGPLPEEYRSKHNDDGDDRETRKYSSENKSSNNNKGSAGALSTNPEDPEDLANQFGEESRPFTQLSADNSDEEDRDESSRNNEVSETPPSTTKKSTKKKSAKKTSKKSKTTTTTTTTTSTPISEEESNETEEDEEEEEGAASNNGPQGLIVNRRPDTGEKPQEISPPASSILKPPTGDFSGEPVDSETARTGNSNNQYIPPRISTDGPTYIAPTQTTPSVGYQYPKPESDGYLPPKQTDSYLSANKDEQGYLSGTSPPTATYLPPTTTAANYDPALNNYSNNPGSYYQKPSTGYGPPTSPNPPSREYLPGPPTPNQQYLPNPPQQQPPSQQYLPNLSQQPQPSRQDYLPSPKQPSQQYLPNPQQQQPSQQYLPSPPQQQQPSQQYLPSPPQQQQPSQQYLPSPPQQQQPSQQYLPSPPQQQQPSQQYLPSPPQQQQPSQQYLPSPPQQQQPNQQYLPSPPQQQQPNQQYLPSPPQQQQPNQQYLPSPPQQQHPSQQYLPSPPQQQQPSQQPNPGYLPPSNQNTQSQQPNQGYHSNQSPAPRQPNREYLQAPPQQQNQGYTQFQQPPQSPSREYLPTSHNLQQPPSSQQYLPSPSQAPNIQYLPSKGYSQESNSNLPVTTTVEHWPAKYDYEAPTSPASVQQYSIPTPTRATPNSPSYNSPNTNQNPREYSTLNQQSNEYRPRSNLNSEYLPNAVPTIQTHYSTIPVQTPPPEGGNFGQPYIKRPDKIEFFQVPLVAYTHDVNPVSHSTLGR